MTYDPKNDLRKGTNVRNKPNAKPAVNRTTANSDLTLEPFLLDLFCGAGGCAYGYHLAGFPADRIVGVDIQRFRHFPFKFVQGSALDRKLVLSLLEKYPVTHIHASPPCQAYSTATAPYIGYIPYADNIAAVRQMLEEIGLPYVIENVETAPMLPERTVMLCGCMPVFQGNQRQLSGSTTPDGSTTLYDPVPMTISGGLRVIRHRLFESNIKLSPPTSPCTPGNPDGTLPHKPNYPKYHEFNGHPLVYTTKKSYEHYGKRDPWKDFVLVYGGGNAPAEACRDAMGIDWMNRDEICEAIPPVYTHFIGRQILLSTEYAAPLPETQLELF